MSDKKATLNAADLLVIHDALISVRRVQGLGRFTDETVQKQERKILDILEAIDVGRYFFEWQNYGEDTE